MTSITWATAACVAWANWPRTSSAPAWCASSARSRRLGQAETENLMPHDLINSSRSRPPSRSSSVRASCRSSWTRPTRCRKSRTSVAFPHWAERSDPRARRLRSPRRAPDPLRPRLPDRNAGRPEHRPDQLHGAVRSPERVRLPGNALPQDHRRQGQRPDRLPVGHRGKPLRHRAGQRRAGRTAVSSTTWWPAAKRAKPC